MSVLYVLYCAEVRVLVTGRFGGGAMAEVQLTCDADRDSMRYCAGGLLRAGAFLPAC
jgi:hypothetical protein